MLTHDQMLAQIDAGNSVLFNHVFYTLANRASVPSDAAINAYVAAQHEAGLPTETLDDLTDVIASGAVDGQLLGYKASTGKWIKVSFVVDETNLTKVWDGNSGILMIGYIRPNPSMSDLSNAGMSQVEGHAIVWSEAASAWIDARVLRLKEEYDSGANYIKDDVVYVDSVFYIAIADNTGSPPATSPLAWYPVGGAGGGGGGTLDALSDVIIDHVATGHIIQFDGANWVNTPLGGPYMQASNNLGDVADIELALSNLGLGLKTIDNPMTAGGAMIVGQATTNFALASGGASITGSAAYGGNVAANVIDGNDATKYQSVALIAGVQLTIDLGAVRTIGTVRLKQPGIGGGSANTYNVQTSPEGSSWTTIVTHTTALNDEIYNIVPQNSRYWRFVALTPRGADDGWHVFTIDLYTSLTGAGTPMQLPAGAEGQVLRIVSGVPTWVTPPWT